ncbi:MAG: hypothetical protein DI539_12175 [Flavobacterium psychrophilum]|jgi:HEPN domain-containing protein/predicted nucleotidyltransferase|nr:MAG: hypothetical protein DI539_12175 [Flavobacterium psychrophilum]
MKTSLSHLPENNQREIKRIAEIIREVSNPEMIILYGSYAKGNFTEHTYTGRDGIRYEYMSDYDLLVVTKEAQEKSYELEDKVVNRSRMYKASVNMEIHDIEYINYGLERGQYFFSDIVNEGILLADSGRVSFVDAKELTPKEEKEIARNYYSIWFTRGEDFLIGLDGYLAKKKFKVCAFILHQATESFYYAMLLVFTGYKPKTHNLGKLKKQIKNISEDLFFVFPEDSKKEKHIFDLLKKGYVDARYKDDYEVSEDEINSLIERINELKNVVKSLCDQKIT